MGYEKINVPKPGANSGNGLLAKSAVSIIFIEDILSMPARDAKGVVITGNIVMKPNKYAITVYATNSSIALASNSEGDPDNEGFKPSVKFSHPGNKQEIREFKANVLGEDCIVVIDYCDGTPKDLIGEICNPVKLQVNYTGNKDANSNEITFAQVSKGKDIAMLNGTVPYAEPVAVFAAGATEIALTTEGEYQLQGDTTSAAIATLTGASHGLLFTLLGSTSGTAPAIAASSAFILKDGASWSGSAGKQITFKCFKNGASTYVAIEQSRA